MGVELEVGVVSKVVVAGHERVVELDERGLVLGVVESDHLEDHSDVNVVE